MGKQTKNWTAIEASRVKEWLSRQEEPRSTKEIAEFLNVSTTYAYTIILYMMDVQGIVDHIKLRGRLFFLKGKFDEKYLADLVVRYQMSKKSYRKPRSQSGIRRRGRPRKTAIPTVSLVDEHLVTMQERARSGGPSALAIIGLAENGEPTFVNEQTFAAVAPSPLPVKKKIIEGDGLFIIRESLGSIKDIPKGFRLLTLAQTKYLKEQHLKNIPGYDGIEGFSAFFADFSALEKREYGNTFFVSSGTNSWNRAYKATVLMNTSK